MSSGVTASPDALAARLFYLKYPAEADMENMYARPDLRPVTSLMKDILGTKPPDVQFPSRPPSPASFHKLVKWYDYEPFWESEVVRQRVVRGLFPEKDVPRIMSALVERPTSSLEDVVKWIGRATPSSVVDRFLRYSCDVLAPLPNSKEKAEAGTAMGQALLDRAAADPTGEWEKIADAFADPAVHEKGFYRPDGVEEATAKWRELVGMPKKEEEKKG